MDVMMGQDVIQRWQANPLITPSDLTFRCSDILNAGVAKVGDEVLLLITVQTLQGNCQLHLARSHDGHTFEVVERPFMRRARAGHAALTESFGIRDPRITRVDGLHYIAYVADGDHGAQIGLARTTDFQGFERMGYVTEVDAKNGALFPRKVNGKFTLLHRPDATGSIWLGFSEDLEFWGGLTVVMTPRKGYWDCDRVGAACPPIEIEQGWLLIYYGEKYTSAGPLVRLGAAILDRDEPSRVLRRSNIPILSPREHYERVGDVPNIVFSCGCLLDDDVLQIYYGASDSCICLGEAPLGDVIQVCIESEKEF